MVAQWLDVSTAAYHADPCPVPSLSASAAHTILSRSPYHAWREHPRLGREQRAASAAMIFGTVVHANVLGCGASIEAIPFSTLRSRDARDARDAAIRAGRLPVSTEIALRAARLAVTIQQQLAAFGIALDGRSERAITWTEDSACGPVVCRGQMDHVSPARPRIIDLKIVRSAHPRACARHLVAYGCDIQAAAYTRALEAIEPSTAGRTEFLFVFCERDTGAVTPVRLAGDLRALGESKWRRAVETWARCMSTGQWPVYVGETVTVEAPQWALAAEEEAAHCSEEPDDDEGV